MAPTPDSRSAEQLAASRLSQRGSQAAALASGSVAAPSKEAGPPSLQSPVLSEPKAQRVENGQVAAQQGELDLQEDKTSPDGSTVG